MYELKYSDKGMFYLADFTLVFFIFLVIRINFWLKVDYPNLTAQIFTSIFLLAGGTLIFLFAGFRYKRKVIFFQNGVTIKKYLKKPLTFSWDLINKIVIKFSKVSRSSALAAVFISDIENVGQWKILLEIQGKNYCISLYNLPFSLIDNIKPILQSFSQLKNISNCNDDNPKRKEESWVWKKNSINLGNLREDLLFHQF